MIRICKKVGFVNSQDIYAFALPRAFNLDIDAI